MTESLMRDVSDTARWVAGFRAIESARPDALFRDPLAAALAGPRGAAMAAATTMWPTVVRTKLLDDLILDTLARGCDRVINLAAGLDTRPYRLPIPAEIDWYEADLPALSAYKESVLAGERAHCRRVVAQVDLTDSGALTDFLVEATAGAGRVLVLTEGLLPYLTADAVGRLSTLLRRPPIRWWLMDHWSPGVRYGVNRTLGRELGSAKWHFASSLDFFEGWSVDAAHSTFRAAARWRRSPLPLRGSALLPDHAIGPLERSRLWSGAVRLTPAGAQEPPAHRTSQETER
ncbi:class I SAM-dependent methyltransferase [Nocardia sp. NPDC057668]|uniref:class I SAM-dependent methyltransferase n=1 Tax=Nocardia sp. NPDC057668 TaxID=3346202 RepID=UPI0036734FC0